ncbi:MAG: glutamate synthase central domain-containing protein, partial [bacterium]
MTDMDKTGCKYMYEPQFEHDACGVGFVVAIDGTKSHDIVRNGIQVLENLRHRGASGGDGEAGDGAGMLVQIPDAFFRGAAKQLGIILPESGHYGVGMLFVPREPDLQARIKAIFEQAAGEEGLLFLGWRDVPVSDSSLGERAAKERPSILQCFVGLKSPTPTELERRLYVLRKVATRKVEEITGKSDAFYAVSMSCRTIVYKGMMMGGDLSRFYLDLGNSDFASAVAVVHQRYSTNTFPSWKLAQPFRYLAHNGEINTLRGNVNQMQSRERFLSSPLFGQDTKKLLPVIEAGGSDSACLDNALELLTACGRDLAHSMLMLVPQAWGQKYPIGPDLRGFFEYHSGLMEPWDGPAAIAFTDGSQVGAMLDRNGLRPARYTITRGGLMILASEAGVLDIPACDVMEKGALRPGQMILVDLHDKRVIKDGEIKATYARRQPYRRWVEENKISLHGLFNDVAPVVPDTARMIRRQKLFGYTREDLRLIVGTMASEGHEPIGSMGYDAPLAILSEQPQLLYSYFKQLFAQVTNPPIDPI